jgi:hypothetical protein
MMKLLSKLFDKWSEWAGSQERKALERYLSQSQTIGELEERMRKWQVSSRKFV